MHERRTFLTSGIGAAALAVASGVATDAAAEDKPTPGKPKVVSGGDGTKVWAMGVLVTVKVKAGDTRCRRSPLFGPTTTIGVWRVWRNFGGWSAITERRSRCSATTTSASSRQPPDSEDEG